MPVGAGQSRMLHVAGNLWAAYPSPPPLSDPVLNLINGATPPETPRLPLVGIIANVSSNQVCNLFKLFHVHECDLPCRQYLDGLASLEIFQKDHQKRNSVAEV